MTKFLIILLAALCLPWQKASGQEGVLAFVNVNVLPLDRERVEEGMTVLVRNGLIEEVAPSYRVTVPEGARIIPGEERFLIPGLGDMHVLLPGTQATSQEVQDFFWLFLANGVTAIRGMEGHSNHLRIKQDVSNGVYLAPTVYAGAPPIGGANALDPDATATLMLSHRSAGYDFQPIAGDMAPEVWDHLAEEAHGRGYTFGGTIPPQVGLRRALSSGISTVEHMDGYLEEVVSDEVRRALDRGVDVPLQTRLEAVEGRKLRAIAAHTRSSDAWVVPTLFLWESRAGNEDMASLSVSPEMAYVSASVSERWVREWNNGVPMPPETASLLVDVRRRILRALTMAGVGVLMGSDSPEMFNVPGFSLRHELRSMAAAGLTPYEIIVTGTRSVGEYARNELLEPGNFGTVEEGNRADLILLRGNPFLDLEALWDQEGVMVRGRWIPRGELDAALESIAGRLGG